MRNLIATETARTPHPARSGAAWVFLVALLSALCGPRQAAAQEEVFVPGEGLILEVPLDTAAFLNGGYAIDSAGMADLPVLGKLQVGGKSRKEVEDLLGQKLANYLRDTHVKAVPAIRLTFVGHWVRQGQYFVSPRTTVWDATLTAGGVAGERNLRRVTVWRGETELKVSFLNEFSRGTSLTGAGLQSGDIFVFPVPRDNEGFWFWFRESLTAFAQLATIVATVLTAYITYLVFQENN